VSVQPTLTRLVALELWTSFRLLAALALLLSSGAVALLVSELAAGAPRGPLVAGPTAGGAWYALALAAALAGVAGLFGAALAGDRRRGFSGWLVSRTAPRASLLLAWFGVAAAVLAVGGSLSGAIAWLALVAHGMAVAEQATPFAAAIGACLAAGLAGIGVGLLAGTLLPPLVAALVAALVVGGWLIGMTLLLPSASAPGGGFVSLATFHLAGASVAESLRSAGLSLGAAAAVLVAALAAFGRVDL
jgi:hypothetical protein